MDSSGGRVVAGSNPVTPTGENERTLLEMCFHGETSSFTPKTYITSS